MTSAKVNYSFDEKYLSVTQVLVTNNLGRAIEHKEIVALDGFVGEATDFDGIADGASGYINVYDQREVGTTQINITDTFVVGCNVFFVPGGSSAAGTLRAGYIATGFPIGICTAVSPAVSIYFKPFAQKTNGIRQTVVEVTANAATVHLGVAGIPVGAQILDTSVICKATVSSGTLTLEQAGGTDIVVTGCATANAVVRATTFAADTVVGAGGLYILGSGSTVRGVMTITWR